MIHKRLGYDMTEALKKLKDIVQITSTSVYNSFFSREASKIYLSCENSQLRYLKRYLDNTLPFVPTMRSGNNSQI